MKRKDGRTKNLLRLDILKEGAQTGDGTVPIRSSSLYKNDIPTHHVNKENFFDEFSNNVDFHGLFLRDSRVQSILQRYFRTDSLEIKVTGKAQWWQSIGGTVKEMAG